MHGDGLLCAMGSTEDCTLVNALDTLIRVRQVQREVEAEVIEDTDMTGETNR